MWTEKTQVHLSTLMGKRVEGGAGIRGLLLLQDQKRTCIINNIGMNSSTENHPMLSSGEVVFYYAVYVYDYVFCYVA